MAPATALVLSVRVWPGQGELLNMVGCGWPVSVTLTKSLTVTVELSQFVYVSIAEYVVKVLVGHTLMDVPVPINPGTPLEYQFT